MKRTVLITGASSGLGLHTAIAAGRAGFTPIATMRDLSRSGELQKAAADAGVEVDIRQLDVTDHRGIEDCVRGVIATHGRLDALVNNAGIGNNVPTIELADLAAYRANFEVNFFGVLAVTKAALPHLRRTGGRVVTIGSSRGLISQPFNEAYSAAKAAVSGFMESLAPVAAGMGVTVVMVEPGPVLDTNYATNVGISREWLIATSGPYEPVLVPYLDWVARTGWPGAQPAHEVAAIVVGALTDPDPDFRIVTSDWVREYASLKFADIDGNQVRAMTRSWVGSVRP
jgi:NAD(P)-dependent dehydrogenase (short-subunit alcohol dehydrogenase family)